MIDDKRSRSESSERGQILVLVALMMVLLIAITGLAIDVSAAYMADRWQRAVADASSLAGGQDLEIPGSRELPGAAQYQAAREHAMDVLVQQLGATAVPPLDASSPCFTAAGCALPGTPYVVSIRTPSPSWVDCEPERCIQVAIRQPSFGLTFARILGQNTWSVNTASVAGRIYEKQYGIVTLRPPAAARGSSTQNEDDIKITGGSKVIVGQADVATNTNVVCSGFSSGSELRLDGGFRVYHFDPYEAWVSAPGRCVNPPLGSQLTSPVDDPAYPVPERTAGTPEYLSLDDAKEPNPDTCLLEQQKVPDEYRDLASNAQINDPAQVTAICVRPGIYRFQLIARTASTPEAILLLPGVYFFDHGVRVQASLIGGYDPGNPGIALVFKEAMNSSGDPGQFVTTNKDSLVALNFGNAYCPGAAGTTCPPLSQPREWASAADGPQGKVETPGDKPVLLSVLVVPDPKCVVGAVAPSDCVDSQNKTLSLSGGGNIFLAGVQYAPTDNATLTGNSGQKAEIGAFWAWTVSFNGGTEFRMAAALPDLTGVLRLDPACSPTVAVCNP